MIDTTVAIVISAVLFGLFVVAWFLSMILCKGPCSDNLVQDCNTVVDLLPAQNSFRPYAKRRDVVSWHTFV